MEYDKRKCLKTYLPQALVIAITVALSVACNSRHFTRQLDIADSLSTIDVPKVVKMLEQISDSVKNIM